MKYAIQHFDKSENNRIPISENLTKEQADKVKLAFEDALYEFGKQKN